MDSNPKPHKTARQVVEKKNVTLKEKQDYKPVDSCQPFSALYKHFSQTMVLAHFQAKLFSLVIWKSTRNLPLIKVSRKMGVGSLSLPTNNPPVRRLGMTPTVASTGTGNGVRRWISPTEGRGQRSSFISSLVPGLPPSLPFLRLFGVTLLNRQLLSPQMLLSLVGPKTSTAHTPTVALANKPHVFGAELSLNLPLGPIRIMDSVTSP